MDRAEKRRQTIIKNFGSWEAYLEHQAKAGRKSGVLKIPKGLAKMHPDKKSEVQSKGGTTSRPPKKPVH